MKRILLALIICSLVSACSHTPIKVETTPIERTPLELQEAAKLTLEPVQFDVVTKDNVEAKLGKSASYIALTPANYESLARNIQKIEGYIAEQKEILKSYKAYYEPKAK